MLILKSILLVSLGVLCSATEDDFCKERRPQDCFTDGPDDPIDSPDSEEALDKQCIIIQPKVKCVLDFMKKCPDTPLPNGLGEKLDDIFAVVAEACDKDSELNKGLAIHLPCIEKNTKGHVAACKPMVKEVLEEMTSHLKLDWDAEDVFPNDEDRAKYLCVKEALDMSCFVASTNVKCGEEAGEISASIIDRVGFLAVSCPENLRDDMKELLAIVQPLMELKIATEEMISKIK